MSANRLWYKQPAEEWEEALPLGNGRMGAMIYGNVGNEQIQVNEESMWYGGPVDRINPDTKEYLPKIRELILGGDIARAERLMKLTMSGCPNSMHPYQTLGKIWLEFNHSEDIHGYERELDLDEAVCSVRYTEKDITFQREVFFSYPDNCMVMKLGADMPGKICFTATLEREKFFDGVKKIGKDGICLYGNLGRGGYEFTMELHAKALGGAVYVLGETLCVENADEAYLYFCADSTYHYTGKEKDDFLEQYQSNGEDLKAIDRFAGQELCRAEISELLMQQGLQAMLQENIGKIIQRASSQEYIELKKRHIADYTSLFKRVIFDLGDMSAYDVMPTDERLEKAVTGSPDIGLSKLYFDYGRYLLIACSRPGTLPATLQGLWNKDMTPPWDSKYTININTQMNYWLAENANLSECHEPLFELIHKLVPSGRRAAREMYGCRGLVVHHNADIRGDAVTQDLWIPGSYWVLGAAWLCTHMWTHYQYTLDKEFLTKSFPVMCEAAEFFIDFTIEKDGYLMTCPSVSPENSFILPNGEKGANDAGVTMDNQILRDLFTQCIEAADILEIDEKADEWEVIRQIKEVREKLIPTRIGSDGTILEWREDYEEWEPGHRHISHLYALHPSEQITIDATPELARAARATLEKRLANGGGHTGWSRAWIINHYAKLWDGEAAYANLEQLFAGSTYPNMFDKHPPFQIDGNFGAAAAIAQMLVQSNDERVVILPALPSAWKSGSIKGLRIKGNAEITVAWEDLCLVECSIKAYSDLRTMVMYQGKKVEVMIEAGKTQSVCL